MKLLGSNVKADWRETRRGFTLFEVLIIVAVLIGLLAILLPAWKRATTRSARINCTNHLKQVGLSFKQWALDYGDMFPMQVSVTNGGTMELVDSGNVYVHFLVMSNELNTPKILICPQDADPKRLRATTFASTVPSGTPGQIPFTNDHSVSYFVGVDANETMPQMFLAGDRNLEGGTRLPNRMLLVTSNDTMHWSRSIHRHQGNVALADGSVQSFSSVRLLEALRNTGVVTNRLAFP